MRGIEDIKEVFHPHPSGLSVVEKEQRKGEEGPVLDPEGRPEGHRHGQQAAREGDDPHTAVLKQAGGNREQDPEEPVIHGDPRGQKHQGEHGGHRQSEGRRPIRAVCPFPARNPEKELRQRAFLTREGLFHAVGERHENDGEAERQKNAEIEIPLGDGVDDLAENAEDENSQKIAAAVSRIAEPFGDAERV